MHDKTRLTLTVAGVSLSMLLIFTLTGSYQGFFHQATIAIDNSGADLWVAQKGASQLYFSISFLPLGLGDSIAKIGGVQTVSPFSYQYISIKAHAYSQSIFYFGYDNRTGGLGGPWSFIQGSGVTRSDQIVIDATIASKGGLHIGDQADLNGQNFTVVGITSGTSGVVAPFAFVSIYDAIRIGGGGNYVNYFLVKVVQGTSVADVSSAIRAQIPNVDVFTNSQWAISSRDALLAGITPTLDAMVLMGGITGILIIGLTNYTATIERQKEYGIMKALGVKNRALFRVVLAQSIIVALSSFVIGGVLTLLFTSSLSYAVQSPLPVVFEAGTIGSVFLTALLIGSIAALLPARRVAKVDPAVAFK